MYLCPSLCSNAADMCFMVSVITQGFMYIRNFKLILLGDKFFVNLCNENRFSIITIMVFREDNTDLTLEHIELKKEKLSWANISSSI